MESAPTISPYYLSPYYPIRKKFNITVYESSNYIPPTLSPEYFHSLSPVIIKVLLFSLTANKMTIDLMI